MKLTKNFSKSEFDCSCGCEMPTDVLQQVQKVANQLQILRNTIGKSIAINSGYRCSDYNDNVVKGAKNSQHKLGKAADIVAKGIEPTIIFDLIDYAINNSEMLQGGLGNYSSFTHYDIRKNKARWSYIK
tara:strand:+ start:424 stop:810 length:387 start_codon:yes stop_codon:yes gene_type:complete